MPTVLDTIDGGTRYLEKRSIEDARLSMQLMVARRLDCTRMQLYMDFDKPLTEEVLDPLRDDLKKRGEGIPLQHILGTVEFYKRSFQVDARALVPRPETEELVSLILAEVKKGSPTTPLRILDVGTGTGVIGLSLAAELPDATVTCLDISPEALSLARENAETFALENVTFLLSDSLMEVTETYDLIVSNPPYVAESERATASPEVSHDPDLALYSGPDGLDFITPFIPAAHERLTDGGLLALEIGYDQADAVTALLQQSGFRDIHVKPDLTGIHRFPMARKG